MRRGIACGAVVLGLGAPALGANTRFIMEVSGDLGATWGPAVTARSGTEVKARLIAQFVGPETVSGLAGFNMTFRVNGWDGARDTLRPWSPIAPGGITGIAGGVAPGGNGRQFPFAAGSSAVLPDVPNAAEGDPLQINGSTDGRIPVSQGPQLIAGSLFNSSRSPVVFIFSFVPTNGGPLDRVLRVNVNSIHNFTSDTAKWYRDANTAWISAPQAAGDTASRTAFVTVTPAPGVLAFVVPAVLVLGGRGRRRA